MTASTQENQAITSSEQRNSKDDNLVLMRQHYEKQLANERAARQEAERIAQEARQRSQLTEEDDDDEPYVDKRKLEKKLAKFGEQTKQQTQGEIQKAVGLALQEERKQNWIKQNPDFYDVVQNHAEQFARQDPELAETILSMPEGFERQKLVYRNIKALGLDKPRQQEPSIQQKIDANRRSPFYQPSNIGTAPYSQSSDFSPQGQKQAFDKMQELKRNLRLG